MLWSSVRVLFFLLWDFHLKTFQNSTINFSFIQAFISGISPGVNISHHLYYYKWFIVAFHLIFQVHNQLRHM